jgi:hypothetical protein
VRKLVFILILFIAHHTNSQTSFTYQLKPPSVTIHFGSGQVRDINTSDLYSYGQVMSSCPTDGHYSFVPATSDCFRGDWHTLEEDHTPGDASGNMLLVNASYDGGAFLATTVNNLKAGANYELGLWLMNVCRITDKCPFPLLPDITIRLQTLSGETMVEFNTGYVARVKAPHWTQHKMRFTMPPNASSLKMVMIDNSPGGCGNDFVMDDITFSEYVKVPVTKNTKPPVATKTKPAPKKVSKPQPRESALVKKKPEKIPVQKQPSVSPPKDSVIVKRRPALPPPPSILTKRSNSTIKNFEAEAGEIKLDLYDNGEIDGDTVSIYHNNKLIVSNAKLSQKPITFRISVNADNPHHELVMVAENLGSIPPNTSLMIVTTATKRYQVFISSTEQKNGRVIFDLKE